MTANDKYEYWCRRTTDINEHLPILKRYAEKCYHITEFGVRNVVSTWAFLAAQPKVLRSYDIEWNDNINEAYYLMGQTDFKFQTADVLKIEIEPTDLLFIDTLHIYSQLKKELQLHADKVSKYLIFHDTITYALKPEPREYVTGEALCNYINGDKGIWAAIDEFMQQNNKWRLHEQFSNNNGLTILRNIKNT
jgi:hypothetical protein